MEPFDPTKPNIARVWDYWLGATFARAIVVPVRLWTAGTPAPDQKAPTATFLAGVARKP